MNTADARSTVDRLVINFTNAEIQKLLHDACERHALANADREREQATGPNESASYRALFRFWRKRALDWFKVMHSGDSSDRR